VSRDEQAARLESLEELAHRVMITRRVRSLDWEGHEALVEGWCWNALDDALEELAEIDPAEFGDPASDRHDVLLRELREDLGLARSDGEAGAEG
jgi:hypothetical protein